jgi:hypothetical protein
LFCGLAGGCTRPGSTARHDYKVVDDRLGNINLRRDLERIKQPGASQIDTVDRYALLDQKGCTRQATRLFRTCDQGKSKVYPLSVEPPSPVWRPCVWKETSSPHHRLEHNKADLSFICASFLPCHRESCSLTFRFYFCFGDYFSNYSSSNTVASLYHEGRHVKKGRNAVVIPSRRIYLLRCGNEPPDCGLSER